MSGDSSLRSGRPDTLGASQILAQLDRVLASAPFRTSKRCSDLLRHVVQASCDGRNEYLKERTLGIAVFERDPEYDTNQDPVVRNTAGQVRKRLAQYYCEIGHELELRIDLPAGAYVPQIYQPPVRAPNPAPTQLESVGSTEISSVEIEQPRSAWRWRTAAVGFGLFLLAGIVMTVARWHAPNNVDLFWAPMLKEPGAVVLCVGQGHTYKLRGDRDRLFEGSPDTTESYLSPTGSIPLSDVVPTWDRAIGISDAQTLVRLTALFARLGRDVEFRGGRSTSLNDLRGKSVVLIGAFNNSWTLSLTGELRFYFDEDTAANTFFVRDRQHPLNVAWGVRGDQQTNQDHADYAIVSRVFNPTTEQAVVVAAGIKGGGTAAAGEFLTSATYLDRALERAPAHWKDRNVQFVLKTRLLGGTAGPPQVIAVTYW